MWFVGLWSILITVVLVTACSPSGTGTPPPTQILIPPTITDTPTPVTPTITAPTLPGPEEIANVTPTAGAVLIPAIAQPLVIEVIADLAQRLAVSEDTIRLVRLEAATWTSIDFGCGEERLPGVENLKVDGYRLVLAVGEETYEYHTDSGSTFRQCERQGAVVGEVDPQTLLDIDPVAAELVILAQRRLGQTLNLPTVRIRLVDIVPVTWTDSSLGCPSPGQEYRSIEVDGYRIVMAVGDEEYIFHTDSERLTPCDVQSEVLP